MQENKEIANPTKVSKLESTPIKSLVNKEGENSFIANPQLSGVDALKKVTGIKDSELAENILYTGVTALESILAIGKSSSEKVSTILNIVMQNLHDFQPRDAIEARLISQANALFQHGMDRLGKSGRVSQPEHIESYTNMAIKLLRAHNETVEAINKHRRGGIQQVIVHHQNNVVANNAMINNVTGVDVTKKQGESPCSL